MAHSPGPARVLAEQIDGRILTVSLLLVGPARQLVDQLRMQVGAILLLGSTAIGQDLAELVAARLETGLTAHCIDLVLYENGVLKQWFPADGGMISITSPERRPQTAIVAKEGGEGAKVDVIERESHRYLEICFQVFDRLSVKRCTCWMIKVPRSLPSGHE